MYINRALLLMFGVLLVFFPAMEQWVFSADAAWYRPFIPWFVLVVATCWNQLSRAPDEL